MVKRLAAEEGISMAELIRQAIDSFMSLRAASSDVEIRERAKQAAGRFRSGFGDIAARHDEYFTDSILP